MFIDRNDFEKRIKNFQFKELFNELGWDSVRKNELVSVNDQVYQVEAVAEKRDFLILHCSPQNGAKIPDASGRKKIDRDLTKRYFEHLIIFSDDQKDRQIWQLSIREPNKPIVTRETTYFTHQTPELLFQKLRGLFFTLDEEDHISLVDVKLRVTESFNTNAERVTKKFYERFKKEHTAFLSFIAGIEKTVDRDWYASLMLNRLMFIYFIQKKGFLDDNKNYLRDKLKEIQSQKGTDKFYSFYKDFLLILFHKGLGAPEHSAGLRKLIGRIPYLNGGLFDEHDIEKSYSDIRINDEAFERVFDFFDQYEWHLDTSITATGREINPDVIGYIFEKYINDRASMGAYYTKEDITEYIGKNTIIPFLFDEVKKKVANAFHTDSSLWKMLQDNPDRYIYLAVRHGVYECAEEGRSEGLPENYSNLSINEKVSAGLPENIAIGVDTEKPDLLERRKHWNSKAPETIALPTEIYREVIERRKRYWEIREKIANGEIKEINDFITYNLDIRQFAQDAVQEYEGSDFINAFYKALNKISVLDPTCGSGAFLFAALNILEPLYMGCIERMRTFVEEDDLKASAEHGRKFEQFRKILAEIDVHPSQQYYVFKTIIMNNLYGVDIMHEAVEIAKLRLFLKLTATVDVDYSKDNLGLEPLPDLDFNLRAGNTLVGFAKLDDVNEAVGQTGDLFAQEHIDSIKEQAEYVKMAYRAFRIASVENDPSLKEAKETLAGKLKKLNDELDVYQAHLYGINAKDKPEAFAKWKSSHHPFHWFAEFYDIVHDRGGFDVIIGNPPYVEYSTIKKSFYKVNGYATKNTGNLYSYAIERSNNVLRIGSFLSFIVQLPIVCTDRMIPLQNLILRISNPIWISTFDDRPGKLFDGLEHIRATIFNLKKSEQSAKEIYTSNYNRWHSEVREALFPNLTFFNIKDLISPGVIPKIGNNLGNSIIMKIMKDSLFAEQKSKHSSNAIYFHNSPQYWIRGMNSAPYFYNERDGVKLSSQIKIIFIDSREESDIFLSLINSSLFYWWFLIRSDCRHLNMREIDCFPISLGSFNTDVINLSKFVKQLMMNYEETKFRKETFYKTSGKVIYDEYYPKKSKSIIDEIDKELAKHYGFTEEELDFIINYDIKYRMGDALYKNGE